MTKDLGAQSPADSPSDDLYKSKRGRRPSQAKLAMLESKKLFADKKRFLDGDDNKRQVKKKKLTADNNAKNASKIKKKKNAKGKGIDEVRNGKKNFKKEKPEDDRKRRRRRNVVSRYDADYSDDELSSEEELWGDSKRNSLRSTDHCYDDRDDLFFESDDDGEEDDFDNDILQNSDEDTEDASETDMATLEEEISEMKEQMYQEKIKELKGKLEQLQNKTLPEFVSKLEELQKQKEEWIRRAYAFKAYEEREIEREYEREKKLSKHDFEQKKDELKEILINELHEKKKMIETEKSTLELTGGMNSILPLEVKPAVTRKLRRRPNDPPPVTEKKRKTATMQLNILLTEEQVLADLKKLNKHHKSPPEEKPILKNVKTDNKCDPAVFPDGSDAKIKDEKLYFNKEWYQSGDPIYLNTRDRERFNAQIHSITSKGEIWIKKLTEGTRLKIYVGHLQRGKYAIERRDVNNTKK